MYFSKVYKFQKYASLNNIIWYNFQKTGSKHGQPSVIVRPFGRRIWPRVVALLMNTDILVNLCVADECEDAAPESGAAEVHEEVDHYEGGLDDEEKDVPARQW